MRTNLIKKTEEVKVTSKAKAKTSSDGVRYVVE